MRMGLVANSFKALLLLAYLFLQTQSSLQIQKMNNPEYSMNDHMSIHSQYSLIASPLDEQTASNRLDSSSLENRVQSKKWKYRQLQSQSEPNTFIKVTTYIFQVLFPICRNLILIGIMTNSIDLFLPYIILSQSFLMLGFWASQKHYLYNLFAHTFSSYLDILNAMRILIQPANQIPNLPQLSQYGFSSFAFINISGEFFVAFLLLLFTILSKITIICTKYEYLRTMATNLQPIWYSYFFAIFPRVATLTGLHWRALGGNSRLDTFNAVVCSLLSVLLVAYFIAVLIQTRRIILIKKECPESREKLGLLTRIDFKKQFQFDFLQYSCLYYPCMNYVRLFIYFMPIGLAWDCKQVSYGGPFLSQFLMIMIQVTSTGYIKRRNKIAFPTLNLLLLLVQLCLIIIGLAESVPYSQISQRYETFLLILLVFIFTIALYMLALDASTEISKRCNNRVTQCSEQNRKKDNETIQTLSNHLNTRKFEGSDEEAEKQSVKSYKVVQKGSRGQSIFKKQNIKKVRPQTLHKCNFIFQ